MKKYLIIGGSLLVAGLFMANYIFSAIPDNDWKKELQTFNDAYTKAKTHAEKAVAIRKIAEIDHPGIVKVLIGTVLPRELKENELLNIDIVISCLSKLSDQTAVDELIASTKKANPPDKIILIQSMAKISTDPAKTLLLELLKNNDNAIKIAAIDALAESSPPEALDTIIGYLDSKSWEVKVSAIYYLAKVKDEETRQKVLPILRKKLNSETSRVKNDLSDAINKLLQASGQSSDENAPKKEDTISFFDIPLEGDLIFVIDVSASMAGKNKEGVTRWDKLMEQINKSIEQMAKAKPPVKFNIIAYAERVGKFQNGLVPAADNKDKAIKWLDTIKPVSMMAPSKLGAYTNIYDAVETALVSPNATSEGQKFVFTSGAPNAYTICLMTDGSANRGKYTNGDDILVALRILNQTRKIRINTIALDLGVAEAQPQGMGGMYAVDPTLMERIAKDHNGTCVKF